MKPLVSVIMCAYNAEKYIFDAIQSVRDQDYPNIQLVLVHDMSDDNTGDVIQYSKAHELGIVATLSKNTGYSVANNVALSMAIGGVITNLDADDVMDASRVSKQVAFLIEHPNIDIVSVDTLRISDTGKAIMQVRSEGLTPIGSLNGYAGGSRPDRSPVMMSKATSERLGPYNTDPQVVMAADLDRELRAWTMGLRFGHIPQPLYHRRVHAGQISTARREEQRLAGDYVRSVHRDGLMGVLG